MDQEQQLRWRPTRRQLLWACGVVVVLVSLLIINCFLVHHSLWHWLKLLVFPAVIAGGGIWINAQQREREQRMASERTQDDVLQAYLDGMSELLTDKERPLLRAQPGEHLSILLRRLEPDGPRENGRQPEG